MVLALLFIFVYLPLILIFNTWAVSILWGWYLTPYLPVPSLPMLMGLLLTIRTIRGPNNTKLDKKEYITDPTKATGYLLQPFAISLFAVIVGWIISFFI